MDIVNNKDNLPLEHYFGIYKTLDYRDIAARANIIYDEQAKVFKVKLVGTLYNISFPEFIITNTDGVVQELPAKERILLLRFLCESKYTPDNGKQFSYAEIPWGNVYLRNFNGRCILRASNVLAKDKQAIYAFTKVMENTGTLNAVSIKQKNASADSAWRFEFIDNMYMSIILWEGDDEFPSSSQFLFSDNLAAAFSAEDIVVATEIAISRISKMMQGIVN